MTYEGFVALNGCVDQEERQHVLENYSKRSGKGSLPKGLGSREEEMAGKKAGDFETHETLEVPA